MNGNGWRVWVVGIVGVLITAGVIAIVKDSSAQRALKTQVEANQREGENERRHIAEDLKEMKQENKEEHKAIRDQMDRQQREILDAINQSR